ncbi:mucin-2-like [Armigeres subalbatus]|uniref:mucin-2-like n=1 Tax=Armigeres subalbatus TaxID=124917 RepID=UPI002ED56628
MKKKLLGILWNLFVHYLARAQSNVLECEKEGFSVVQSTNCASYYYCVISANNEFYQVLYECPAGQGFSLETLKCIPEEDNVCGKIPEVSGDDPILLDDFECPSQGRFPVYSSIDCKAYYTCPSNMEPVLNSCPSTTIFSWTSMKCVMPETYTCPNSIVTTTEIITTSLDTSSTITSEPSTEEPTQESTTVNAITTEVATETPATTQEPTSEETTVQTTVSEQQTTTVGSSISDDITTVVPPFTCTESGRFPEPESSDCKNYYLCTVDLTGTFEATLNQCPSISVQLQSLLNEILLRISVFDPEKEKCVQPEDYLCLQEDTTTVEPSTTEVATQSPTSEVETFVCTGSGRFPDPTSSDCKGYYLCSGNGDGTYVAVLSRCPTITVFSLDSLRCVLPAQYQCPLEITSTQPVESSTVEASTEAASTTDAVSFICSSVGRHPDLTDCTKYKFCVQTATKEFLEYSFNCPAGTYFDPTELHCSMSYVCPFQETTTTSEASEITTSSVATPFVCASSGRFSDPSSVGCETYITCSITATGDFLQFSFKCPNGSLFSKNESKCINNYVCVE